MRRVRFIFGALLAVLWMAPLHAQQPTGTVRGRVVDNETKLPLQGVTVTIGSRGARTLEDGRYSISGVPAGTDSVRARMLGYAPATQAVTIIADQTVVAVDIAMTQQAVSLSEIVVVGYGQQTAGDITGAVTQLTPADFNTGQITTPTMLLENKVAGVQVVDNNSPGGSVSIRIRGTTSINASSDPLYVVDGMPVGTGSGGGLSAGADPLNFLNPNDIESITVLKDASSAAIYGANSANGVIIITTKHHGVAGGAQGPRLDYSGTVSTSSITRIPSLLNAAQFDSIVRNYGTPQQIGQLGTANTDWYKLIDRTAYSTEHNLAISGATQNSSYRISAGYLNQQGIIQNSASQRVSLGINFEQRLFDDNLDIKVNARGARTYDKYVPGGVLSDAANMGPTQPVYDPNSVTGYYNYPGYNVQSPANPVEQLNLATSDGTEYRSIGNVEAEYRLPFFQALKANINVGYDIARATQGAFTPSTVAGEIQGNEFGYENRLDNTQLNTVFTGYLNYSAPLNVVPGSIDVTGGYSYSLSQAQYATLTLRGLSTNFLGENGTPTATSVYNNLDVENSKLISFFGRVNYNLADRYLAAFAIRRDGSSRFGPTNAWGVFPSVSLAWRLSEESWMKGFRPLSDLKLRASWGKTGNQPTANYLQYATYTPSDAGSQVQFGTQFIPTLRPGAYNPNIKWEETNSYDLGVDYGFLNQRISGAIDWYIKNTSDMIFTVPIAAGTNLSNSLTTNIGAMRNSGIELSLSARILEGRGTGLDGIGWTADFTASRNANTLTAINPIAGSASQIPVGGISGGTGNYAEILTPGQAVNTFWVCRQYYDPTTGKPVEGEYYWANADSTFTGGCDGRGLRAFHDPAPKWMLGHTSYLTYGNFDLSFTLRAWIGNWVYNNVAAGGFVTQGTARFSPYNMSTSVLKTGFQNAQYFSDVYVEDGSFLRMDNLTLGYNFKYLGQPMRAYVAAQNVFTITGYSGVDPTTNLNGLDNNIYPRSRTFTGGLSIRF